MANSSPELIQSIQTQRRIVRQVADLEPLIGHIGDARIVMLGESTHGTHEYYEWRRMISEWLIVKKGFNFIAVEGDWPPCLELNRYIWFGEEGNARTALEAFHRWPTWMWANAEMVRLAEWMRSQRKASFYGLDVYSLFESIDAIAKVLEPKQPFLARRIRQRFACFDAFQRDEKAYVRSLLQYPEGCEQEVLDALKTLLELRLQDSRLTELELFDAQQNARVVRNAERYYRTMIHADESSWNVRDEHMLQTLEHLLEMHSQDGTHGKAIVWAHNSHIGDYRATDMLQEGLVNLGGLARKRFGERQVALVGFGTHHGSVIASHAWDGPIEKMTLPPAHEGSYEHAFHEALRWERERNCYVVMDERMRDGPLGEMKGHRAVGVVYDPRHERWGNYVPTSLARRYDAFVYLDETSALAPMVLGWDEREIPDTWPIGR